MSGNEYFFCFIDRHWYALAFSFFSHCAIVTCPKAETRIRVQKTYKLFIGGKFVRGENGRVLPARGLQGATLANYCRASRKDFRDTVVAARKAQPGWAKASAYLRSQILYRAAEILENRCPP